MAAAKPRPKHKQHGGTQSQGSSQSEEPAKKKPPKTPKPPRTVDPNMPWRPWLRCLLSLAIVWHVTAVFAAPWILQFRSVFHRDMPLSEILSREELAAADDPKHPLQVAIDAKARPFLSSLNRLYRPYLNLTYLNHGYDFFTPNPTGSYLLGCVAYDAQGEVIAEEVYPDIKTQFPRLYYHRHLMLAAQGSEFGDDWSNLYGQHLIRKHDAARVVLTLAYHRVLPPKQVLDGTVIDASTTYEERDSVTVYPEEERSQESGNNESRPLAPVRRSSPTRIPGVGP
ncbi:MAG: hypothetical protein RH917_01590 [Lacipirellulaceae bacterium]